MNKSEHASCTCAICQAQCKRKPGWFKPGEAEKVAEFLGMSLEDLFSQYLMPDSWELENASILTLSPAIKGMEPGVHLSWAGGECVFFKEGRCSIHSVKPYECRTASHLEGECSTHFEVALSWVAHQGQVLKLQEAVS